MRAPEFSVAGVLDALNSLPARGAGRALMFVAARAAQDVTEAASAVATAAGPGAIYAIDLDMKRNALAKALAVHGDFGPRIDGRLNGSLFFGFRGANGGVLPGAGTAYHFHRVGRSRVYAGVLDVRAAPKGARVAVSSASTYWDAVRAGGAVAVVEAPALERSQVALHVGRHMDGVVLVVGGEPGAAPAAIAAKAALVDAGANVMGLVYAGASAPVMAIERVMRQAG